MSNTNLPTENSLGSSDEDDMASVNSDESSGIDTTNQTKTGTSKPNKGESTTTKLAQRETQLVKRLRCLAYSVLLAVAITASVGVYWFSQQEETKTFQNEFHGHGTKVIASFQEDSYKKLQSLASLSSELTRYALSKDMVWPFVTVSQSSYLLGPYLSLGDFAALQVHPIVPASLRDIWEPYSVENQGWIEQDLQATTTITASNSNSSSSNNNIYSPESAITPYIKNYVGIDTSPGEWIPMWQYAPVIANRFFINFNRLAWIGFHKEAKTVKQQRATLSPSWIFKPGLDLQSTQDFQFTDELLRAGGFQGNYDSEPLSYIHYPVVDHFESSTPTTAKGGKNKVVAILTATVYWTSYFSNILPEGVQGIVCVVENNQGQAFTYEINAQEATFLGMEDLHETKYDDMELSAVYSGFDDEATPTTIVSDDGDSSTTTSSSSGRYTGVPVDDEEMSYRIRVYPSSNFEDDYRSNQPLIYAFAMLFMFVFTASIILLYDRYVEQRQKVVLTTAKRSTAVVASLFPKTVRDRVMEEAAPKATANNHKKKKKGGSNNAFRSSFVDTLQAMNGSGRNALDGDDDDSAALDLMGGRNKSSIIADFFPEATVMFTDIRGFTAWCSAREPAQVFALLETLYGSFDKIAKRRRIFKVETIGDCYVACAGCPTPRDDHAVAVCRFARDCLYKMQSIFKKLEQSLGPGTGDLSMRFGLHSGPVTGGVVRGENARFQLFGDTMNVAARMESNGAPGRIHLSKDTADLLKAAGKSSWIEPRAEKIKAKGKEGLLQTYWLRLSASSAPKSLASSMDDTATDMSSHFGGFDSIVLELEREKEERLINWNTDVLIQCLKQIVGQRKAQGRKVSTASVKAMEKKYFSSRGSTMPFDEVCEVIPLPKRNPTVSQGQDFQLIELDDKVTKQVRFLVENIALMYRSNPFHSFDHASNVVSSVKKLLSRIVDPRAEDVDEGSSLHDHTFGITAHPLTQFGVVFSALIHDIDHVGVPNAQLVAEEAEVALKYDGKSVAEQNSVDLAYYLLMKDEFADLRATIYSTEAEMTFFRQLVVNCVLATDIVDKQLKELRNARWEKAFSEHSPTGGKNLEDTNRRATIVLEHLIQASDIAHTMQHWHIYRQWNRRLFEEMYIAYKEGRSQKDPSEFWYHGEIGFFDFYIIPLAKKLKECGVFGVSSAEYLDYARKNREEWEEKGASVVSEMIAEIRAKHDNHDEPQIAQDSQFLEMFSDQVEEEDAARGDFSSQGEVDQLTTDLWIDESILEEMNPVDC